MQIEMYDNTECSKKLFQIVWMITFVAILAEMLLFFSLDNFLGCCMTVAVLFVFQFFVVKRDNIIKYPFSFFAMLSLFAYRFLPLFITLIEGKPITHGMELPVETFFGETVLFAVAVCAYNLALKKYVWGKRKTRNFIQELFWHIGIFETLPISSIVIMGIMGVTARITTLSIGGVSVVGFSAAQKFLNTFNEFIYVPVILFFPCLYSDHYLKPVDFKKWRVWAYVALITILCLGTNSRNAIIAPFATIALLYTFCLYKGYISGRKVFNANSVLKIAVVVVIAMQAITMISNAMLLTRSIRSDVSFQELIGMSIRYVVDSTDGGSIQITDKTQPVRDYDGGWTEEYIDNFMLNRFANIRITDETLYLGKRIKSTVREQMQRDFFNRVYCILPSPILNMLGIQIDKSEYSNSRGDYLYYISGIGNRYSLGGYRITSHLGDGYATFGWWYHYIQLIIWFICFKLMNMLSYSGQDGKVIYSCFAFTNCYSYFSLFRNTNGILFDITFIMRTYWQEIVIFCIALFVAKIGGYFMRKKVK